jgi:uncharacterized protein YPO0396
MRQQRIDKENEKLKKLDNNEISKIENESVQVISARAEAELDYSGAGIKMRLLQDLYRPANGKISKFGYLIIHTIE